MEMLWAVSTAKNHHLQEESLRGNLDENQFFWGVGIGILRSVSG
jgi:hypothetical protein